jgi:hypothetical protein
VRESVRRALPVMTVPVHRRPYAVFLSHAHADAAFVNALYAWLHDTAGVDVWFDSRHLDGGTSIRGGLSAGIENCRGMLILGTREAIEKGWVEFEVDVAMDERARSKGDFRVIPLRIDGAPVDSLTRGVSWIDMPAPRLDMPSAAAILRALYPADRHKDPRTSRDVYISSSWRSDDSASGLAVCRRVREEGLRMIGDSKDQKGFRTDRIKTIIESCGALVSVIPFRDGESEAFGDRGPYRHFLTEIACARSAKIPIVVIADDRVRLDGALPGVRVLPMRHDATECSQEINRALAGLAQDWTAPVSPQYIFLSTALEAPHASLAHPVRELIERVTGMATVTGQEIRTAPVDQSIMESLTRSHFVLADLSGPDDAQFNLDVCIEVGMARAMGVSYELFAKGPKRRPPFMLGRPQAEGYADDLDLLGKLHRVVRGYRRRLIDAEIPASADSRVATA